MINRIIYSEDGHKVARPILSRKEYLELRSSSEQVNNLKLARSGDKEAKKRLVQMNYSCIPNADGTLKGSKTPSNSVGMDVDFNPQQPEYTQQMKDAPRTILDHEDELGLLMLERSVNKGYHLVFRRRPELSQEDNLKWASNLLGIEYDRGAKDLTRVFFTTSASEDDLLYLSDELFDNTPLQLPQEGESSPSREPATEAVASQGKAPEPASGSAKSLPTAFRSVPYSSIISHWFDLTGGEPVEGERHTRLKELAFQLRPICDNSKELLLSIMPRYGLSEEEVKRLIDWNCDRPLYGISDTLTKAIDLARAEMEDDLELQPTFTPAKLPPALKASLSGVPKGMHWPVIAALLPLAATYADGVGVEYCDGATQHLGLMSVILGPQASGKSVCRKVIELWKSRMAEDDRLARQKEDNWKEHMKIRKANEKIPEAPHEFIREVPVTISCSALLKRAKNGKGHTLYSFSEELDTLTKTNGQGSWTAKYDVYRLAFDRAEWGQDYNSEQAESGVVNIAYNWTMCGTYGAMEPVIKKNTENGLASRLIVAEMPDNSFAPMQRIKEKKPGDRRLIEEGITRLCSSQGFIDTPRLRKRMDEWQEEKRIEAKGDNDHVKDNFRKRSAVIGFRAGVVCHLLSGDEKESKQTVDFALAVAELTLRGQIRLFGREFLKCVKQSRYIQPSNPNMYIFHQLPSVFTIEDLKKLKGEDCKGSTLRSILSRWKDNGLIEKVDRHTWSKIG